MIKHHISSKVKCFCINVFTKFAWIKPLKNKKDKTVLNAFVKIVNELNLKLDFYNKHMQECLHNNDILMYSTYNEGKSVIAERFKKTLETKIY